MKLLPSKIRETLTRRLSNFVKPAEVALPPELVDDVREKRGALLARAGLSPEQIAIVDARRPVEEELSRMVRGLAEDRGGKSARSIEAQNVVQRQQGNIEQLQSELAQLKGQLKLLTGPAPDSGDLLAELQNVRRLMGAREGESTTDAILRKLGTNRMQLLPSGEMDMGFGVRRLPQLAPPAQTGTNRALPGVTDSDRQITDAINRTQELVRDELPALDGKAAGLSARRRWGD